MNFGSSKIEVKAKVPLLAFDYNAIMVCLPLREYSHGESPEAWRY
jgi:hypothetical protein